MTSGPGPESGAIPRFLAAFRCFRGGADGQVIVVPTLEAGHVAASRFSLQNGQLISGVRLSGHAHPTAALSEPERRVRSRRSRLAGPVDTGSPASSPAIWGGTPYGV